MTTVTQWFAPEDKPTKKGVYQVNGFLAEGEMLSYSFWDKCGWCIASFSPEGAFGWRGIQSMRQQKTWRGLAERAK